jgi:hypothetical protein
MTNFKLLSLYFTGCTEKNHVTQISRSLDFDFNSIRLEYRVVRPWIVKPVMFFFRRVPSKWCIPLPHLTAFYLETVDVED